MCEAGSRSTVATTRATSSTATGEVRPAPNGRAIVPFSRIDRAAIVVNIGVSRNTVDRMCTTGRPDQFSTCSASQCSRCWCDSAVLVAVICETVICDRSTRASSFPVLLCNGGYYGRRQQVVWRHRHREEHPRHALQRRRHRLGPDQVSNNDLGAEPLQLGRALVLAADHETHRHILSTQLLEDRAAHASGAGDKNKLTGSHESSSLRCFREAPGSATDDTKASLSVYWQLGPTQRR